MTGRQRTIAAGLLALALLALLASCGPAETPTATPAPATPAPVATATAEPVPAGAPVEWRQERDGVCETASLDPQNVRYGPCGQTLQTGAYAGPARAEALARFVAAYAPFEAETPAGWVRLAGQGQRAASAAEQRMLAEWARLAAQEAAAGRGGASWGLALAWHREGGIAGFCDDLAVYVTGEYTASSCAGPQPADTGHGTLSGEQMAQLYTWLDAWQPFEVEQRDAATADSMTVKLVFSGSGAQAAGPADQQAVFDWAGQLYAGLGMVRNVETQYVLALRDLSIYAGPGTSYAEVGPLFGGQTALVTGASGDLAWWRVICPDDTVASCWVSADPALTQPATPPAPLPPAGCVAPPGDSLLLADEGQGYCLGYPAGYQTEQLQPWQAVLYVNSLEDVEHPHLSVTVEEAAGRTAAGAADALLAEAQAMVPGLPITRTERLLDEEQAVVLDGRPGQDLNREVLVVHNERLYRLAFRPADPSQAALYAELEALYNLALSSFRFIEQAPTAPALARTPSPYWVAVRDPQTGVGLAYPCFWVIDPPTGPPSARSFDEAYAMARSVRGQWVDDQWPAGAVKVELVLLDYASQNVTPGSSLEEALPQLISDEIAGMSAVALGRYGGTLVTLANVDNPNAPDRLTVVDLGEDRLLLISVWPRPALESADVRAILASITLSPLLEVALPLADPAPPVAGRSVYLDEAGGVCFAYPDRFYPHDIGTGQPFLAGPALDESVEPLRASLLIDVQEAPAGELGAAVDAFLAEFASIEGLQLSRQPLFLGGEPAEMVEVVPGREGSRDVLALHNGQLYRLLLLPSVPDFPQAAPDVEELFMSVTSSWTFLR